MTIKVVGGLLFPLFFFYQHASEKCNIDKDMARYPSSYKGGYYKLVYLLMKHQPFRAIFYYRIRSNKMLKNFLNVFSQHRQRLKLAEILEADYIFLTASL